LSFLLLFSLLALESVGQGIGDPDSDDLDGEGSGVAVEEEEVAVDILLDLLLLTVVLTTAIRRAKIGSLANRAGNRASGLVRWVVRRLDMAWDVLAAIGADPIITTTAKAAHALHIHLARQDCRLRHLALGLGRLDVVNPVIYGNLGSI
jgi:hypothetical protein